MDLNSAGGGQTVFCNPPYGRAIKDWVKKSSEEVKKPNTTVVMLIPVIFTIIFIESQMWKFALSVAD